MNAFPIDRFYGLFPVFKDNATVYTKDAVYRAGKEAMHHITDSSHGMPMENVDDREYALFLMTAHILVLNASTDPTTATGSITSGGSTFKSTIGSVSVENTKPNSFTTDDWSYWLNQTEYGRRLLAYLDVQAPFIMLNTVEDSVRVLF